MQGTDDTSKHSPPDQGEDANAQEAGLLSRHVQLPVDLPRKVSTSWWSIENTLYYLAVIFGVLELPKVTPYEVWNEKTGKHWANEEIDVVSRSPKIDDVLARDIAIVEPDR